MRLAARIAARYSALPQVEAVVLAGSQSFAMSDSRSDLDLYVYTRETLPLAARARIAMTSAARSELDNRFFEPSDEWVEADSGTAIDVMFRFVDWIEEQLDRVLLRHQASVGYSTCFWHNVQTSQTLYDRNGWYRRLQSFTQQPYPEPLRRAVIAKNHPLLRRNISSFLHQIELATERGDLYSVHHRISALLASYFDILFAVNRMPHPGEKRLLDILEKHCLRKPAGMRASVEGLLRAFCVDNQEILNRAETLVSGLDDLLRQEGLFPEEASLETDLSSPWRE